MPETAQNNSFKRGPVKRPIFSGGLALFFALAALAFFLQTQNLKQRNHDLTLTLERLNMQAKAGKNAPGGPAEHGALRVENGRLTNQHGRPVQLRGLSSHGLVWFPEYANFRALMDLRSRGANLFRAAMYADSIHEGYNENEISKRLNRSLLYLAVENALAADMYVIVDWHILLDQNPLLTVDAAVEFFDEVSSLYPDNPAIIYEICNEPNGDLTWRDIHSYASRVIPAIRQNSPQAVILVGTPKFSTDILSVLEIPLSFPNLMYSFHFYAGENHLGYKEKIETMLAEGLGVFVSEWGIGRKEGAAQPELAEARDFIAYLNQRQISWANWSLSNKNEPYSALKPEVRKLSRWLEADLSPAGRLVFEALAAPDNPPVQK